MDPITAAKGTKKLIEESNTYAEEDQLGVGTDHAIWMLEQIINGEVRDSRAHRWLGYAQGLAVVYACATLDEVKEINRSA